jgi:hypothetical protein
LTGSSSTSDRFYGKTTYGLLLDVAGSYYNYANGFATVTADVSGPLAGGADKAIFYDSANADLFVAEVGEATMDFDVVASPGVDLTALGFSAVYGSASSSGDKAELHGSALTDDKFIGTGNYSEMRDTGGSHYSFAGGFDVVTAFADSVNDQAYVYDAAGADNFIANPADATMSYASGKRIEAKAFDRVYADFSNAVGDDFIDMAAEPGVVNQYIGKPGRGIMTDNASYWLYLSGLYATDTVQIDDGDGLGGNDLDDYGIDYDFILLSWL